MSPKKKKSKKKQKKFLLELTFKSAMFWGGGFLFLLVWTFILGILVGREYLSFGLMKDKIAEIQGKDEKKGGSSLEIRKKPAKDPKFAFYEELSSKKAEVAKKDGPISPKRPAPKKSREGIRGKTETRKEAKEPVQQYVLQVGSFGDKAKATALADRLKKLGYPAYSLIASVDGKLYYRVKCGPVDTEKKADEFKRKLAAKENIHGFVTRDRNQ